MMLRNLLHEIVRRRLWPIPVLAVLVALAAPVLFMKSAPAGAPAADTAAPAPAVTGDLPARAQRLLAATAAARSRGGATGSARDPFQAPAGHRGLATAAAAASGATAKTPRPAAAGSPAGATSTSATKPVPVVIQNADGTTVTTTPPRTGSGSGSGSHSSNALSASNASVDVRFGPRAGSRVHRSVPRLQTYFVHGNLVAAFVKYSPSRNKAVFAVAPGVIVSGPVKCRRIEGVCRYVDIAAGSYARLTMLTPDRIVVHRRLDVERIGSGGASGATTAKAARDSGINRCLLRKLKAQNAGAAPIDRDACER
jgi:hypothetical protein